MPVGGARRKRGPSQGGSAGGKDVRGEAGASSSLGAGAGQRDQRGAGGSSTKRRVSRAEGCATEDGREGSAGRIGGDAVRGGERPRRAGRRLAFTTTPRPPPLRASAPLPACPAIFLRARPRGCGGAGPGRGPGCARRCSPAEGGRRPASCGELEEAGPLCLGPVPPLPREQGLRCARRRPGLAEQAVISLVNAVTKFNCLSEEKRKQAVMHQLNCA